MNGTKIVVALLAAAVSCMSCGGPRGGARIETEHFGTTAGGDSVTLYRMINPSGASMEVIDYGCRVVKICVPDRNGVLDDVVVGYGDIESFETGAERFFGALLGRYANRIAGGRFELDGVEYALTCNEAPAGRPGHLHGGENGFDRRMWRAEPSINGDTARVVFTRLSPDGEEGYPGNLECRVAYSWCPGDVWRIEYGATTDKPTIVCMSQHCYFNLKGSRGGSVLDEVLRIEADSMTPNTPWYVPRGEIVAVEGTPLDFREPHAFAERINRPNEHMRIMGGYSANWVLRDRSGQLALAAELYDPATGRSIEVSTTEPGILIYTGRGLSGEIVGKYGPLEQYGGLILETIHYPDTPNNPHFPSCVLRPGERYGSVTEYRFSSRH